MRYYIYLDKPFLRTILGSIGELDFDIDVIEYSVIKSYSNNNKLVVDPCIENGNNCEIFKDTEKSKNKEESFNSEKIRFGMDKGVSCNIQTERKYINISDISDMKNIGFYHKLITKVEQMKNRDINNRLYEGSGFITIYETRGENVKENNKLDWMMLLVTDIIKEESQLITTGFAPGEAVFSYKKLEDKLYYLPGVLSRKKQLLPEISRILEEISK